MSVDVNQLLPQTTPAESSAAVTATVATIATNALEPTVGTDREGGSEMDNQQPQQREAANRNGPQTTADNSAAGGSTNRKRKRHSGGGASGNWSQNFNNNNKRNKNKQQNIIICGGGKFPIPTAAMATIGGGASSSSNSTITSGSNNNTLGAAAANNNNNINGGGGGKSNAENYGGGGGRNKNFYHKIPFRHLNGSRSRRLQLFPALSKFFLPDKRPRKEIIVPPTKFLLGGNISDPLNLNSLQDDDAAASPKSSPMMTPPKVEVIIPPNIRDPLHLLDPVDSIEYEKQLTSPMKKMMKKNNNRNNKKKKGRNSFQKATVQNNSFQGALAAQEGVEGAGVADGERSGPSGMGEQQQQQRAKEEQQLDEGGGGGEKVAGKEERGVRDALKLDLHVAVKSEGEVDGGNVQQSGQRKRKTSESSSQACGKPKLRRLDSIVSPVIPQPGAHKRPLPMGPQGAPHRNRQRTQSVQSTDNEELGRINANQSEEAPNDLLTKAEIKEDESEGNKSSESLKSLTAGNSKEGDFLVPGTSLGQKKGNDSGGGGNAAKKKRNTVFQFGNYDRYYGYRNLNEMMDVRLKVFQQNEFLFKDKDCLDIGCNVGHLTTAVAKNFGPRSMLGIDIDSKLIRRAKQNASLFVRIPQQQQPMQRQVAATQVSGALERMKKEDEEEDGEGDRRQVEHPPVVEDKSTNRRRKRGRGSEKKFAEFFPQSFPLCYGLIPDVRLHSSVAASSLSLGSFSAGDGAAAVAAETIASVGSAAAPSGTVTATATGQEVEGEADATKQKTETTAVENKRRFPENIRFMAGNYVLKSEQQLANDERHKYDLILCLSVTKWVHLNYGDEGLKMMFRRIFNQLRPGGKLILEAQNWASYKKKKKLTERIFRTFQQIEFYPSQFHEYLLSPDVGFSHSYPLGVPRHLSKGFRRPIQLYVKGDFTPSQVMWSDAHHSVQTPYTPYRGIYAEMMCPPPRGYNANSSTWGGGENTPFRPMASTSQYYNPMETDSYLPSYETEVSTRRYCFQSPLYSAEWSPPSSSNSETRTPPKPPSAWSVSNTPMTPSRAFGTQGGGSVTNTPHHRHVYPPDEPLLDLDNADSEDQPGNNSGRTNGSGTGGGVSSSGDTPRTEEDSPEH